MSDPRCPAQCKDGKICMQKTNPKYAPYCGKHVSAYVKLNGMKKEETKAVKKEPSRQVLKFDDTPIAELLSRPVKLKF